MPTGRRLTGLKRTAAGIPGSPVMHWDFSDLTRLFKDTARTVPVTAEDDIILGVADKSGNSKHLAIAANGPKYKVTGQNSLHYAEFDGTNDTLVAADSGRTPPFTIFVACKVRSTAATRYLVAEANASEFVSVNTTGPSWGAVGGRYGSADTDFHVLSFVIAGASTLVWEDGTSAAYSAGSLLENAWGNFSVASLADITGYAPVDMGEVAVYDTALETAERQGIELFLKTKWGVA